MDSDDYIDFGTFETAYTAIVRDKADIALFNNYEVKTNGDIHKNSFNYIDGLYSYMDCITLINDEFKYLHDVLWNKLYKAEIFNNIRLDETLNKYEDTAILPYIYSAAKFITLINKPLYYYYQSEKSIMKSEFSNNELLLIAVLNKIINDYRNNEALENFYIIKSLRVIRMLYFTALTDHKYKYLNFIKNEYNKIYKSFIKRKIRTSKQNRIAYFLFRISPKIYKLVIEKFF